MDTSIQVQRVADKQADGMAKADAKSVRKQLRNSTGEKIPTSATVGMNNDTKNIAILYDQSHEWYGSVLNFYPSGISPGNSAQFVNTVDPTNGSKAAVVYTGKINETTDCAWLLAWCAPIGTELDPPNYQVTNLRVQYTRIKMTYNWYCVYHVYNKFIVRSL